MKNIAFSFRMNLQLYTCRTVAMLRSVNTNSTVSRKQVSTDFRTHVDNAKRAHFRCIWVETDIILDIKRIRISHPILPAYSMIL